MSSSRSRFLHSYKVYSAPNVQDFDLFSVCNACLKHTYIAFDSSDAGLVYMNEDRKQIYIVMHRQPHNRGKTEPQV